ncbi:hypothetical protein PRIPAC_94627 [Pristionchus pacificus]|uniref:Collagen n=1 Tax=Pristionchus pacificus TaxID=54126 RepID=A0A2A6C9F6_PRIPA|nr:hypothetical protein PRIPAC_94627 [Pristionchus pacificus]|eukprot:PDM74720.1 collagen [Pristionchus pacificus]
MARAGRLSSLPTLPLTFSPFVPPFTALPPSSSSHCPGTVHKADLPGSTRHPQPQPHCKLFSISLVYRTFIIATVLLPYPFQMGLHFATGSVMACSGLTLLVSLFAITAIYNDVSNIWSELDAEMDNFKSITDDLWTDMVKLGAGTPTTRAKRQGQYGGYGATGSNPGYPSGGGPGVPNGPANPRFPGGSTPPDFPNGGFPGFPNSGFPGFPGGPNSNGGSQCQCSTEENRCPPGPDGPMGIVGNNGVAGVPGKDGVDGLDAENSENYGTQGCFTCPQGPLGPQGPGGSTGMRGMRGAKGASGMPGRDGHPGHPGEMGPMGAPGADGKSGNPGDRGHDGEKPIGRKGNRGPPGPQGREGPAGIRGRDAPAGPQGPVGEPGIQGYQGAAGADGEEGPQGPQGKLGPDAEYCPCPAREGDAPSGTWRIPGESRGHSAAAHGGSASADATYAGYSAAGTNSGQPPYRRI